MPSRIVREYDKSTAGTSTYANFSVLVPGFVSSNYNSAVFDENGVYECSSQADFINNVGVKQKHQVISITAVAPTLRNDLPDYTCTYDEDKKTWVYSGGETTTNYAYIKAEDFESESKYKNCCYTKEIVAATGVGKLIGKEGTKFYKYTLATEWDAETKYCVIDAGNEGTNAYEGFVDHYGNEIAYLLLSLGYTVLYKKIDDYTGDPKTYMGQDVAVLNIADFWNQLKDKSLYDYRYIITGDPSGNGINEISKLATYNNKAKIWTDTGRGDCTALCDLPYLGTDTAYTKNASQESNIASIQHAAASLAYADKYSGIFAPCIQLNITDKNYQNLSEINLPASFYYLACANKAAERFAEWYAISGYNRGISSFTIKDVGCSLGNIAATLLQPKTISGTFNKAVNIILKTKKNNQTSYYMWGNRTAETLDDQGLRASHFLNIRQLCTTIKKQIYIAAGNVQWDPNSDALWIKFAGMITPILDKMKADQGIKDYKLTKASTDTKALLKANLRIVPIEAVEDFDIGVYLEDSISGEIEFEE